MKSIELRRLCSLVVFGSLVFLCSCSSKTPAPRPSRPVDAIMQTVAGDDVILPGSLQSDQITYQFAVYYLPKPSADPIGILDGLLAERFKSFHRVDSLTGDETTPVLAARVDRDPHKEYAPPSPDLIHRFGRGISAEQVVALQKSEAVLILDFLYAREQRWERFREALQLTAELTAGTTTGLIWDESTREIFTPAAWNERRIEGWTEQIPDISKYTVIHAYKSGEYLRAITLGMEKFGLPDLVVDQFSWSDNRNVGHIINLFGQAIAEGAVVERTGEFDLDFRSIKHPGVRSPQLETLKPNATGKGLLTLKKGIWEEGDPENRLVEITFDRGMGPDSHARRENILATAFGFEDSITHVKHDEELKAASLRARSKLPELRTLFNAGLEPGEFLQVKAPFDTPDGEREWMWVEVTTWKDGKLTGLLSNEPFQIPELHAGQIVEVAEPKIFDYIHKHPDGTMDGNETGKLIEQRGQ